MSEEFDYTYTGDRQPDIEIVDGVTGENLPSLYFPATITGSG